VAPIIAKLDEIIRLDHPNAFVVGRPQDKERAWSRCTAVILLRVLIHPSN
jgi:hypothetical protein